MTELVKELGYYYLYDKNNYILIAQPYWPIDMQHWIYPPRRLFDESIG